MTNGKRLICITGIDGSGKTTLLSRLSDAIPGSLKVAIWDMMTTPDPNAKLSFRDKKEVDAYLRALAHPARAELFFQTLRDSLDRALAGPAKTLLIDAYWYKYFASELAMHGEVVRPDLRKMVENFPPIDRLFFIDFGAADALTRKKTFSGYESGYAPGRRPEDFVEFQSRAFANLRELARDAGAIFLDGASPVETKVAICLQELGRP